ncbi:MAG: hypothetical protein M3430_08520 [Acidobacteriota bacterium]|nr:hypothetical protein [Acidobacteriota bacterium]
MRYIDPDEILELLELLPEGWDEWKEEAKQALDEVREADGDSEMVNAHGEIWRKLKSKLEEVSKGKCWYCESSQRRADNAVDHYRPKNRNRSGEHEGYWWLAFDWRNYRYSCTYCNSRRKDEVKGTSGGKHDNFPLFNPEDRATLDKPDYSREQPLLLDPTIPEDPSLLWYEPDGRAVPKYSKEVSERRYLRAQKSIELYHLNYYKTEEDRKRLYNKIRKLIGEGDNLFPEADSSMVARSALSNVVIAPLLELIKPTADFSAAARAFLVGFKNRPWVEGVLATS